jgi:hypothetical protein
MGRRRGFLPPAISDECKNPPVLGESLWPGDKWRCFSCLEKALPGEDCISKSMHKMLEYGRESRNGFELESQGKSAEGPKNRAEWAKAIAGEVFKRHDARSKEVNVSNGEAIPGGAVQRAQTRRQTQCAQNTNALSATREGFDRGRSPDVGLGLGRGANSEIFLVFTQVRLFY